MKALARYQIILLGEQRHIGVNNLPMVVARQYRGRESNPRPLDQESDLLTTTPPSRCLLKRAVSIRPSVPLLAHKSASDLASD